MDYDLVVFSYILLGLIYSLLVGAVLDAWDSARTAVVIVFIWPLSLISTIFHWIFGLFDKEDEEKDDDTDTSCIDCQYRLTSSNAYPCRRCYDHSKFVRRRGL